MPSKKNMTALLALGGLGALFFIFSSKPAHAAPALPSAGPPEPEPGPEVEPVEESEPELPAPVPMPPPVPPQSPDNAVIDREDGTREEIPVGDVMMGPITYSTPDGGSVTEEVPAQPTEDVPDEEDDEEEAEEDNTPGVPPEQIPPVEEAEPDLGGEVVPPASETPPATTTAPPAPKTDYPQVTNAVPYVAPNTSFVPADRVELFESPPAANPIEHAEKPTQLPADTADLLRIMLADEKSANWKRRVPELAPWQAARGLKPDQEFGTKSALQMATETGLIPIVRFWPKGSFLEGKWLTDYRRALRTLAMQAEEPRAAQLVAAADRELGQGFGRGQQPISPIIEI